MKRRHWIPSLALMLTVIGAAISLAAWKEAANASSQAAMANQPEPMEVIDAAIAKPREFRRTTTAIGTVLALRSVTLRNELAGTVRDVQLTPGAIVEPGAVLVALDTSVEEAELHALEAQEKLTSASLRRMQQLTQDRAAAEADLERAQAEHDVALAQIARMQAVIERKAIRAPFRARVGLADVHPGQFLDAGTELTSLQGVDEAVHVDFAVAQHVASELAPGDAVEILAQPGAPALTAHIEAIDARIDPATRNAMVRTRLDDAAAAPAPGASVRVRVSSGPRHAAVAVPASALRRGLAGDHVFVLEADDKGRTRAHARAVQASPTGGDVVLIQSGLTAGEEVAADGSFKLRESVLVVISNAPALTASNTP